MDSTIIKSPNRGFHRERGSIQYPRNRRFVAYSEGLQFQVQIGKKLSRIHSSPQHAAWSCEPNIHVRWLWRRNRIQRISVLAESLADTFSTRMSIPKCRRDRCYDAFSSPSQTRGNTNLLPRPLTSKARPSFPQHIRSVLNRVKPFLPVRSLRP